MLNLRDNNNERKNTLVTRSCVRLDGLFETTNSKSEVSKSNSLKITSFSKTVSLKQMHECVSHIQSWMSRNFLRLNAEKTQVLVLGSRHDHAKFTSQQFSINNHDLSASKSARNLGVVYDKLFNMESHISSVCKSANFHLRNIATIRKYLSLDTAEKVIHALVSSRLDCCNALLVGLPATSTSRLQRVHNNAARVVVQARKYDHISPVLRRLHWLPIAKRITFKICLLVFKVLHGQARQYLCELIFTKHSSRALRSAGSDLPVEPRSRTIRYGDRAFAKTAPALWNKLPVSLRQTTSLNNFKRELKTHLFT